MEGFQVTAGRDSSSPGTLPHSLGATSQGLGSVPLGERASHPHPTPQQATLQRTLGSRPHAAPCIHRDVDESTYCDYDLDFIIHVHGLPLSPERKYFYVKVSRAGGDLAADPTGERTQEPWHCAPGLPLPLVSFHPPAKPWVTAINKPDPPPHPLFPGFGPPQITMAILWGILILYILYHALAPKIRALWTRLLQRLEDIVVLRSGEGGGSRSPQGWRVGLSHRMGTPPLVWRRAPVPPRSQLRPALPSQSPCPPSHRPTPASPWTPRRAPSPPTATAGALCPRSQPQ